MPVNASIPLQANAPAMITPDKLLTLKALSQQNQLGQLQVEDAMRARESNEQLRNLFSQPGATDKSGTLSLEAINKAYAIDPKAGQNLATSRNKSLKEVAELEKLRTEDRVKKSQYLRDSLAAVGDQASYDFWRMQANELGLGQAMPIPPVFDPKWQRQNIMTADKFIEQNTPKIEMKDVGGKLVPVDMNPNTNPAIRGTALDKTLSPEGRASDARGAATLAETKRHNQVTESQARLGPPTEVTGPDGKPSLIVQDQKSGRILDANTLRPVGGSVGPKVGETAQKQLAGVATVKDAITEYRESLKNWSATDIANPNARAKMGTVYNNMMLQAKEAYNLGVLNGPDYMILQQVITNPASFTGGITSNKALDEQAKKLDEIMTRVGEKVTRTQSGTGGSLDKSKVESSGWAYEPDKYDYRVGPNGQVQRKKK